MTLPSRMLQEYETTLPIVSIESILIQYRYRCRLQIWSRWTGIE